MKNNNNLKRNFTALKQINPDLLEWIRKEKNADWIQEIQSENKEKNMLVEFGSKKHLIYDIKNPSKEAKHAVKSMKLYKDTVSICMGFGLGYLAKEMLEKMDNSILIC